MARNVDNALTKKAHVKQQWTEEQVKDLVACTNPVDGYVHFARHFYYIQHPVKGKMLFHPYDYQLGLLDSYHNNRFNINMLPRQSGKCLQGETTMINVRNNETGAEYELSIKDFYDMQANTERNQHL